MTDVAPEWAGFSELTDRFRLEKSIGSGAVGTVYRAYDLLLDRVIALKILHPELRATFAQKQKQEVVIAQRISHPNVVRVHDITPSGIAMEYIHGETLADLLRREGPLPVDRVVELAVGLCKGLLAAHSEGIVHSDLKPANILIDKRGVIKISDFGLAFTITTFAGQTRPGGTPAYMSPEHRRGDCVDYRSDIYSLGLILCEMLLGRLPAVPQPDLLKKLTGTRSVPKWLLRSVRSCTANSPADRPSLSSILIQLERGRTKSWSMLSGGKAEAAKSSGAALLVAATLFGSKSNSTIRHEVRGPIILTPLETDLADTSNQFALAVEDATIQVGRRFNYKVWYKTAGNKSVLTPKEGLPSSATIVSGSARTFAGSAIYELQLKGPHGTRKITGRAKLSSVQSEIKRAVRNVLELPAATDVEVESNEYYFVSHALLEPSNSASNLTAAKGVLTSELRKKADIRLSAKLLEIQLKLYSLAHDPKILSDARIFLPQDGSLIESVEMAIAASKYYVASGALDEATRVLGAAVRIHANSPELLRACAKLDLRRGAIFESIDKLTRAAEINPLDGTTATILGSAYLSLPDIEKALPFFSRAAELSADPIAWSNLGAAYILAGRNSEAVPLLEKVVENGPSGPGFANLGQALWYSGHRALALAAFERALDYEKSDITVGSLAHAYRWARDPRADSEFALAIDLAQHSLKNIPEDPQVLGRLATYHAALGDRSALSEIQAARAQKVTDFDLLIKNAIVDAMLGEKTSAIALIRHLDEAGGRGIISKHPDLAPLWKSLYELNRSDRAEQEPRESGTYVSKEGQRTGTRLESPDFSETLFSRH